MWVVYGPECHMVTTELMLALSVALLVPVSQQQEVMEEISVEDEERTKAEESLSLKEIHEMGKVWKASEKSCRKVPPE